MEKEEGKVFICYNTNLFGIHHNYNQICSKCKIKEKCKEIRDKYLIVDEKEEITFSKARDFIKDVWGKTWSYPSTIVENAKRFGYATENKNHSYTTWTISYENIYKLMNMPLWRYILYGGRVHD